MKRRRALAVRALAGAAMLAAWLCGCGAFPVPQARTSPVAARLDKPSVLAVILGTGYARGGGLRDLIAATARTGEYLIVLSAAGGASIGSFTAPGIPAMTGPAVPAPPSRDATAFQQADFRKALAQARGVERRDGILLRLRQQRTLRDWAASAAATSLSAESRLVSARGGLAAALASAAADIDTLQQTGINVGPRRVIAIVGGTGSGRSPPPLRASLNGMTVVVGDSSDVEAAAWQADLLQAGAGYAVALTPATTGRLPAVVSTGLAGRDPVVFPLAQLRYGAAQYTLPPTASRSLRQALRLLAVDYPDSTATIVGYTDDVAVRGGNWLLSWKRARIAQSWLIRHGIAAGAAGRRPWHRRPGSPQPAGRPATQPPSGDHHLADRLSTHHR